MTEPPRHLSVGDVIKASVRGHYYEWVVREVDEDTVLASAPGIGSARVVWYGDHAAARNRSGHGHGLNFYFVRHAGDPKAGEPWRHRNGNIYRVLMLTNTASTCDEYKPQVVYEGANGNVWSRPLSDWHRSFTAEV